MGAYSKIFSKIFSRKFFAIFFFGGGVSKIFSKIATHGFYNGIFASGWVGSRKFATRVVYLSLASLGLVAANSAATCFFHFLCA